MPTRARRATIRSLICTAIGLIGLAAVAIGATLWSLRDDAIDLAIADTANIATVLAEQTARSVQSIDLVLTETTERIASFDTTTQAGLYKLLRTMMAHQVMQQRLVRLPQADSIFVADADGNALVSARSWPLQELNFADRDYFAYFKSGPGSASTDEIYVSAPAVSRISGEQTIFLSKPWRNPRGEFLGVVVAVVKLEHFRHIYDSITSLRGQSFMLLRKDGSILVRHPDTVDRAVERMPATSRWHQLVQDGGGSYRSPGSFDGEPRLVAVRPLRDQQLVVNVAVSEAAALETWRHRATLIGLGTLLAVLCSVFLLRALAGQFRELELANGRVDAALNNMSQGLCMFDRDERLVVCNERYLQLYGLSADVVRPGRSFHELLEHRRARGSMDSDIEEYIAVMRAQLAERKSYYRSISLPDGRVISVVNHPVAGGGWVSTHEDVTERQRVEARMAHMARHDALTDLGNRVLFRDEMDAALARLQRTGQGFSIFVFDLDLFKAVNDSLGHPIGDALLQHVAQRLRTAVPDTDTVGRLGGDEFAVLHRGGGDQRENAIVLANELLRSICEPYDIDGHQIVIGISIGIALAPEHGSDADTLLKNADLALYRAKSEGRNGYRFFESEMDAEARMRHALELDLRNALSRGEFELHYQTIIDVATGGVCGAEALVRWRHSQYGLIPPDKFIPLAEEIGIVIPLGEWIIRQACREAAQWPEHVKLALNLSPVQFRNSGLLDVVVSAAGESGLSPDRLELEVTESVLLQKNAANVSVLHHLQAFGACIALDDFGTGYSSLSYLRMFPFNKIKIDRSFIAELSSRADCAAIVCAITGLARSLNVETTAEGVETRQQFELLRVAGCTQAQGYLFSRPCKAAELNFDRHMTAGEAERAA